MIRFECFPEGKKRALTMSYDDGTIHDRRLIQIFNQYGIKGTFHLNSGSLDTERCINAEEVATLYRGHEVAIHTENHPYLTHLPREQQIMEIMNDRMKLEQLCGYPITGFSYPFGIYDSEIISGVQACGIRYARTIAAHESFELPNKWLEWNPTCRHRKNLSLCADRFLQKNPWGGMRLMYVWGHSYEFDQDNNWELIDDFCHQMANHPDIWYATNIEIYDYIHALHNLRISVKEDLIYNPSAIDVWIEHNNRPVKVLAGTETVLSE